MSLCQTLLFLTNVLIQDLHRILPLCIESCDQNSCSFNPPNCQNDCIIFYWADIFGVCAIVFVTITADLVQLPWPKRDLIHQRLLYQHDLFVPWLREQGLLWLKHWPLSSLALRFGTNSLLWHAPPSLPGYLISLIMGCLVVSVLHCQPRGSGFKARAAISFQISAPPVPLANSAMMSTLTAHCWWKYETVREGTGHPTSFYNEGWWPVLSLLKSS